jgi:hypothetical protein
VHGFWHLIDYLARGKGGAMVLTTRFGAAAAVALVVALAGLPAAAQTDPYETYVNTSKDFQAVNQDKAWLLNSFPSWTYMPWPYQWTIGYTASSGQWAASHGYNGFTITGSDTSALGWINQNHLRFYNDHVAGKGDLHLWDGGSSSIDYTALHGTGVRVKPVNAAMVARLKGIMASRIGNVSSSPYRGAYALDDEISWGHFIHPTMWQVTDDWSAYQSWLSEIYGAGNAPARANWISYENIRGNLPGWRVRTFDASQLMDQWTFNDSYWNNTIGDLVTYGNSLDPHTPVGFVGGQAPNAFGGYDYAKIMKKVQYIESYNQGGSNSIIRSFNPHNAIPSVTTHFHNNVDKDIHEAWYYQAHGNRGEIGWVENWFTGATPAAWHDQVAPTYLELGNNIGPKMSGAEWRHDGVAILYNHASIQLSWIMDAQAHGSTWVNRNGDASRGGSHMVRRAWENMLRDEGIQYNFISYDDVIRNGISSQYKVLILPAALTLSDAEARQVRSFVANGGTVIADYMPGLWDQHGKGRIAGGALDDVFGVAHSPDLMGSGVFGTNSQWAEVDQDVNFSWTSYLGFLTNGNDSIKDSSGYYKAVRNMGVRYEHAYGAGKAYMLNLSPQWYNEYRVESYGTAQQERQIFMEALHESGINRWVDLANPGPATDGYEFTYYTQGDRTYVMLVLNPENLISSNVVGLRSTTTTVTVKFSMPIQGLRDERTNAELGSGDSFNFNWKQNEALVLSFPGAPPVAAYPGDASRDGRVNVDDLGLLAGNYGGSGKSWGQGDFTRDGLTNVDDLGVLASHYDWQYVPPAGSTPVPEPSILLLLPTIWAAWPRRLRRNV